MSVCTEFNLYLFKRALVSPVCFSSILVVSYEIIFPDNIALRDGRHKDLNQYVLAGHFNQKEDEFYPLHCGKNLAISIDETSHWQIRE